MANSTPNDDDVSQRLALLQDGMADVPLSELSLEQLTQLQLATEELTKLIGRRLGVDELAM